MRQLSLSGIELGPADSQSDVITTAPLKRTLSILNALCILKIKTVGKQSMEPFISTGVAVVDGKIYVLGGEDGWEHFHDTIECYTPETNSWIHVGEMLTGRSWLSCAPLRVSRYIYICIYKLTSKWWKERWYGDVSVSWLLHHHVCILNFGHSLCRQVNHIKFPVYYIQGS